MRDGYDYLDRQRDNKELSRGRRWGAWAATRAMGGETGRGAFVKARDWSPNGFGRGDAEKRDTARAQRVKANTLAATKGADLAAGNARGYLDHELVDLAKDPSKHALLMGAARNGHIRPSAIKAMEGTFGKEGAVDAEFVGKLKDENKKQIRGRFKAAEKDVEAITDLAKEFNDDAKAITEAAGDEINTDAMAEFLVKNPKMIDEVGRNINDVGIEKQLRTKIMKAASKTDKETQAGIQNKLENSRTWTASSRARERRDGDK